MIDTRKLFVPRATPSEKASRKCTPRKSGIFYKNYVADDWFTKGTVQSSYVSCDLVGYDKDTECVPCLQRMALDPEPGFFDNQTTPSAKTECCGRCRGQKKNPCQQCKGSSSQDSDNCSGSTKTFPVCDGGCNQPKDFNKFYQKRIDVGSFGIGSASGYGLLHDVPLWVTSRSGSARAGSCQIFIGELFPVLGKGTTEVRYSTFGPRTNVVLYDFARVKKKFCPAGTRRCGSWGNPGYCYDYGGVIKRLKNNLKADDIDLCTGSDRKNYDPEEIVADIIINYGTYIAIKQKDLVRSVSNFDPVVKIDWLTGTRRPGVYYVQIERFSGNLTETLDVNQPYWDCKASMSINLTGVNPFQPTSRYGNKGGRMYFSFLSTAPAT